MTRLAKERAAVLAIGVLLALPMLAAPPDLVAIVALLGGGAFCWWFLGWRRSPRDVFADAGPDPELPLLLQQHVATATMPARLEQRDGTLCLAVDAAPDLRIELLLPERMFTLYLRALDSAGRALVTGCVDVFARRGQSLAAVRAGMRQAVDELAHRLCRSPLRVSVLPQGGRRQRHVLQHASADGWQQLLPFARPPLSRDLVASGPRFAVGVGH